MPERSPEEVEQAVRAWLDGQSVNPATGVAPDAKVAVQATRITRFGEPAEEEWSVTAILFFPQDDEEHLGVKIARILERFETAMGEDPSAGDGMTLAWRGTDRGPHGRLDAPAGYPTAVDVLFTVRG